MTASCNSNDVEIFAVEQLGLTLVEPLRAPQGLAFGAVPVGAGVISIPLVAAPVTAFEMAAERGSPAQFDGAQDTLLPAGQRLSMRLAKLVSMGAHDVCNFQCGSHRNLRLRVDDRVGQQIQGAGCGADCIAGQAKIAGRGR